MSMNMDAAIRIKANVQGGNAIQAFNRNLKGLDSAAKLSGAELGRMNIAINRMAREAGNTTAGLRQHIGALQNLRDRVEIGSKAYKRLGGEIDQLKGKLRGLDAQAEKTGGTLKDKLIGGLAALGVGRLAGGITRTAANFDAELRKASAIEGGGNFDALRKDIERVAAAAAGTPTEVAQLATALSRAGFTAKETGQALQGIVRGAEATAVTFEEMGSIAADSMRAFGIETSKTEAVVDILVKTANSSNQTVQDLGESLKYAAPIARSLGVNINDLAATMGILANNGIRGSEAGTALRTGLGRLQLAASGSNDELLGLTKGSAKLADAMRVLGADVVDAKGNLKPMDEVLISLKRNLENLPKGVQVEVLKALFGDEAGGKLRAALNSTEADIRKMFEAIRQSGGVAAATQKEMQGFDYSLKVLGGNVEIVGNAIGDKFAAVLKPLADGLSGVISWTQKWPQPLKDVAAGAAAAGIAVAGLMLAFKGLAALGITAMISGIAGKVAAAAVALKGLSAAAVGAKIAMIALNAVALINPWVALAAGIAAAAYALANYKRENDKLIASIQTGGAKELEAGRARLANIDGEIATKRASFEDAKGRQRASLARQLTQLRKDREALGSAVTAAQSASTNNIIPAAATSGGDFNPLAGGDDKGAAKKAADAAKKAADEAKRAMDQYGQSVKAGSDITRSLAERLQDASLSMAAIGANATDALGARRLKAELDASREYAQAERELVDLVKQRNEAASKGINTSDLEARIEAATELANRLREVRSQEAFAEYSQGLADLVGNEDSLKRALREGEILLENRKRGIEGLTEVQKVNLQIELLDLEAKAAGNAVLQERINKIRELAGELDKLNAKAKERTAEEALKKGLEDIGKTLGDTLMSAFDNLINKTQSWKEFMSNALKQVGSMLMKLGLNMLAGPSGSGGILSALGFGFEKGGIMTGKGPAPLKSYSRGGIANSPQLALFGEGSKPEAYVPLPDGRRIPVAMQGAQGSSGDRMREVMGTSPAAAAGPVLNMNFETTKIGGVEYVSRDQLEQAMAQTRRQAASDGAKRGMSMTLDKLQQSPSTRSRVGMR
jgi:TP901 family phage tail tape measure protein